MNSTATTIAVTYRNEWQDGFGARGWKLDCALDTPEVIAATAETGTRIPTSVLVHDILDHHLCGLPMGGHRNEAKALYQLAVRTGADPAPDFAQMSDEDLLHGRVNGESLRTFLPDWLLHLAPAGIDSRQLVSALEKRLGRAALRQALIMRFFELGAQYAQSAIAQFRRSGLDYSMRGVYGEGLQEVLSQADRWMRQQTIARAHGVFSITPCGCSIDITVPRNMEFGAVYT